jgi:HPt (histidine-containing phosphotransfer) domain-containing protein
MSVTQHLSYDALNSLKEVMEDDFNFLIETFIQDSEDRLAKLHELVGGDDVDAIRRASHSFKGSCSNLGALRLASLCAESERKALNKDIANLGADLTEIEAEFMIVKQMMLDFIAE